MMHSPPQESVHTSGSIKRNDLILDKMATIIVQLRIHAMNYKRLYSIHLVFKLSMRKWKYSHFQILSSTAIPLLLSSPSGGKQKLEKLSFSPYTVLLYYTVQHIYLLLMYSCIFRRPACNCTHSFITLVHTSTFTRIPSAFSTHTMHTSHTHTYRICISYTH